MKARTDRKAAALANLLTGIILLAAAGLLGTGFSAVWNLPVLGMLLSLGVIATAVPMELQLRGQRMIGPVTFSIVRSISPVFAALVGVAVLGQTLDGSQWAAVAVSTLSLVASKLLKLRLAWVAGSETGATLNAPHREGRSHLRLVLRRRHDAGCQAANGFLDEGRSRAMKGPVG